MPPQFVVRLADDPAGCLARPADLLEATEHAAREAVKTPGVIVEVFEPESGGVRLRVRVEAGGRRVLVQRAPPTTGDAWPDPPAWLPLAASA